MNLWEDREDFRPLGHRLQRVDQEAYCEKLQPTHRRRDYEIDRLTGESRADFGSRWSDFWLPTEPLRKGIAAPELIPADPFTFDDLTAPVLEAVAPRQMELLEWPGV